jgi:hypothetical protein
MNDHETIERLRDDLAHLAPSAAQRDRIRQRVETHAAANPSSTRDAKGRRVRAPRIALGAMCAVAAAIAVFVALGPSDDRHAGSQRSGPLQAMPIGLETASAKQVLNHVADAMQEQGAGPWRYVRRTTWTEQWTDRYSLQCSGADCVWQRTDERGRPIGKPRKTKPDFPIVRAQIWERWSDGTTELGRTQYGTQVSRPCDGEPSDAPQCLGNIALWLDGKTRSSFPRDPADGARELMRLVNLRNQGVARMAKRNGRFPANTISATEVGFWLLTEPVYRARDRANVIRALAAWPGSRNAGVAVDRLGRRGVLIHIPTYRLVSDPLHPQGHNGTFIALFDVRSGRLLQYTQTSSLDPPAARRAMNGGIEPFGTGIVIDEQSQQEVPSPTDETVAKIDFGN